MNLELIFSEFNDDNQFRFHLAKQEPEGTRPIDVLARSSEEWLGWQVYRGTNKERFVKDRIVSFAQIYGNKFLYGGVFNILRRDREEYDVAHSEEHSDLIGRLIIEYKGGNSRGTVFTPSYIFQHSVVSSILEYKYQGEPFCSYDEINHSFEQMEIVIKNQLNDWKVALSNVFGVYLLTDKKTGRHYVGSAYGAEGIWGRWSEYIYGAHGGNKELVELFNQHTEAYFKNNFKFTILEILPTTKTPDQVIQRESLWKKKLLSIEFGYNGG
ncbi:Excinuclease ABC C subunit domain protein [Thiorhodococcus drewsii AZ1]|uniref:Excinuclease ABC C subunit domain protein n=1 Tax=Thiorhodococcus drewsii AZ1 TaxID=765913 RepID=G2DZM5_9GAMM|nr:GIY-YIG nuclease family protein [Thiorhodococcus drewsii]EGV32252.1 Excinuclease ABC C subunit domain protein [Thiorhodococcus drewsii AZ1]